MMIPERYDRNRSSLSEAQQRKLAASSVLVLGCGGVGGYVIEYLARIGVGHITAADGDVFQPSNLNRQLLSTETNLGENKAAAGKARVRAINSTVDYKAFERMVTEENAEDLMRGKNAVVDCLDSPRAKLICARAAQAAGVPFVHGAIAGWSVRVHTVLPGDRTMEWLCASSGGVEALTGNLPFTAAACAALVAAEAVKLLLGIGEHSAGRLIEADLLTMRFDEIELR